MLMTDEDAPTVPSPPWPFLEIVWEDSAAHNETWAFEEDLPDTAIIVSRGWAVKQTKRAIKLAASCAYWADTGKWIFGESVTIPRTAFIQEPTTL